MITLVMLGVLVKEIIDRNKFPPRALWLKLLGMYAGLAIVDFLIIRGIISLFV